MDLLVSSSPRYRRYIQAELQPADYDHRRYFGEEIYREFMALKRSLDPDGQLVQGLVCARAVERSPGHSPWLDFILVAVPHHAVPRGCQRAPESFVVPPDTSLAYFGYRRPLRCRPRW